MRARMGVGTGGSRPSVLPKEVPVSALSGRL